MLTYLLQFIVLGANRTDCQCQESVPVMSDTAHSMHVKNAECELTALVSTQQDGRVECHGGPIPELSIEDQCTFGSAVACQKSYTHLLQDNRSCGAGK